MLRQLPLSREGVTKSYNCRVCVASRQRLLKDPKVHLSVSDSPPGSFWRGQTPKTISHSDPATAKNVTHTAEQRRVNTMLAGGLVLLQAHVGSNRQQIFAVVLRQTYGNARKPVCKEKQRRTDRPEQILNRGLAGLLCSSLRSLLALQFTAVEFF